MQKSLVAPFQVLFVSTLQENTFLPLCQSDLCLNNWFEYTAVVTQKKNPLQPKRSLILGYYKARVSIFRILECSEIYIRNMAPCFGNAFITYFKLCCYWNILYSLLNSKWSANFAHCNRQHIANLWSSMKSILNDCTDRRLARYHAHWMSCTIMRVLLANAI